MRFATISLNILTLWASFFSGLGSVFEHFGHPWALFLSILSPLGHFGAPLGGKVDPGSTLGRILGGFWAPSGALWGHFGYHLLMFFSSLFKVPSRTSILTIFYRFCLPFWYNFGNTFSTSSFSENRAPAYTGTSIRRVREVRKSLESHYFFACYFKTRIFHYFY